MEVVSGLLKHFLLDFLAICSDKIFISRELKYIINYKIWITIGQKSI